jgi:hypothetical protein
MSDYALAFPQPVKDFDLEIGATAYFNLWQLRKPVLDDERTPVMTVLSLIPYRLFLGAMHVPTEKWLDYRPDTGSHSPAVGKFPQAPV